MFVQSMLVHVQVPIVQALHPLNGIVILAITYFFARTGAKSANKKSEPSP
jgi:hypothetical protein